MCGRDQLFFLQFLIDDFLEVLERPLAHDLSAVDEDGRCVVEVHADGQLFVALDLGGMLFSVDRSRKPRGIEPEFLCILNQAGAVQLGRSGYQQIMHLPVFSLIPGRKRRFRRKMRIVAILVWVILDHDPDFSGIHVSDLLDDRTGRHTVRSLEIDEFDERDRGIRRAERG